jgi:hypothetical protein
MEQDWYLFKDGKRQGPLSWHQLYGIARSGGLDRTDMVWSSLDKDWIRADRIPELFESMWKLQRGTTQMGPFTWSELWQMAHRGEIRPADKVWSTGGDWQAVGDVQGLLPGGGPKARHISLMSWTGTDHQAWLFSTAKGPWVSDGKEIAEEQVREKLLAVAAVDADSWPKKFFVRLDLRQAMVLRAAGFLIKLVETALGGGGFCTQEDICHYFEEGLHWTPMSLPLFARQSKLARPPGLEEITGTLASLSRQGLVRLIPTDSNMLVFLKGSGESLADYLIGPQQQVSLVVSDIFGTRARQTELFFLKTHGRTVLCAHDVTHLMFWSVDADLIQNVLDWAWQSNITVEALAELEGIGRKGEAG